MRNASDAYWICEGKTFKVNAFPASFVRGPRKETRQAAPNSTMPRVMPAVLRLKITDTRSER